MADSDLDRLRAQRLAELKGGVGGHGGDAESQQKAAEERYRQANDMKNAMLSQILDQSARARLNTLMLGKPEKGQMVENLLLQMAQTGQVRSKLGEEDLIGILEKVSGQTRKQTTTVKFDRRRAALDSDDDDDDL